MKLTHNKVAFLAILFMLISLSFNIIIYQKASIQITGKATAQGYVIICLNRPPILNEFPTNLTAEEGETFFYDVNATDIDGDTITYYDNTTLFNINSATGIISFTPAIGDIGSHTINISASDGQLNDSKLFTLNVSQSGQISGMPTVNTSCKLSASGQLGLRCTSMTLNGSDARAPMRHTRLSPTLRCASIPA